MKDIINTIFVGLTLLILMILLTVMFIPYLLLRLFRLDNQINSFMHFLSSRWGRFIFALNRSRMNVKGLDNLPDHKRIIYIGNHQGYADIPFLMANMPTTIGFFAKKELSKVPLLGLWMRTIHCIFLDRGNFRKAMRDIEAGLKEAAEGYPKVIFPEGTRSQSEKMAQFKEGSILLAAKAGLTIVPVTINGTYKLYEEKKKITPADLELTVHPAIDTADISDEEKKQLRDKLWTTIASALPNKGE